MEKIPEKARVVIIGGGVILCAALGIIYIAALSRIH